MNTPSRAFAQVLAYPAWPRPYGATRLALACERALAAGTLSSGYVERLLKADRRQPFLDQQPDESLGVHSFVRGFSYYN